ncbi:SpoIIE family protein phosphatase [Carboxylicivirga sp. N1Y90]|uniref:SpoIIE family protein phosphatase n=1 Tax=Carboxylicivirga fragile TaxID=3417571 RepID=UPI003D35743A|nr:SpoIIE family protein phosphatase [Marinilabiliaceae bacterium N1Y90]
MKIIKTIIIFLICSQHFVASGQDESSSLLYDSINVKIQNDLLEYRASISSIDAIEEIKLLKEVGTNYHRINALDSAVFYYDLGAQKAFNIQNKELFSALKYNLSLVYFNKGMFQSALDAAIIALETDKKQNNLDKVASSLNIVSLIYQEWSIYDRALEYRLESIKISEETGNYVELANGYFNLGSLFVKIGKHDKAMNNFSTAKKKYQTLLFENPLDKQLKQNLSECIYSIGGVYLYKEDYDTALEMFNEALEIKINLVDKIGIGNCYYQIGLLSFLHNELEQAKQSFFHALQFKNSAGDKKGIALVYYRIADLYYHWKRFDQSENFARKSIHVANEIEDRELLQEGYKLLYHIYSDQKKYKMALHYHELYKSHSDLIINENIASVVEELNVRYETEKQEKENKILIGENRIKELTIQKQKSMGFYLIGMIVLILVIVIVLYILYRSKRRANRIVSHKNILLGEQNVRIAHQNKEIEAKSKDLTDSIQYALRIQEAMLLDSKQLNEVVQDAFILLKPKDIVSGDFYWFTEHEDKAIIAAIDCTGHGVPGAFMSMLGNTLLNQIVLREGITSPELILERLSQEVQLALKQEKTQNQDGMDMALCVIDKTNNSVSYSGAKNPLIIIKDGEATRIKANKKPIGISRYEKEEFVKHTFEVDEETFFYMFSDGFVDQFGGPKGKKFMVKRFQQLLLDIHQKPMHEQSDTLNSTLNKWMRNDEQIDDVLVVGFKLVGK